MVELITSLIIAGALMGGVVVFAIMFAYPFYVRWRWPIQVPVIVKRGKDGILWNLNERGRVVKGKDGKREIRLRKSKESMKQPSYKFVTMNNKGKAVYPVTKLGSGMYGSVNVTIPDVTVADTLDTNWMIQKLAENAKRYAPKQDWKMALLMYGTPIAFLISTIFFWIYFGGKFEMGMNSLSGAATRMAMAMEKFAQAPPPPA